MLEFLYPYFISFLFYLNMFIYFNNFKNNKLAINEVAAIHANGSVLLFGYYLYMKKFIYFQLARYFLAFLKTGASNIKSFFLYPRPKSSLSTYSDFISAISTGIETFISSSSNYSRFCER